PIDLDVARGIEREFRVSLAAAALRVAELTSEAVAVVFSRGGVVRWARSSPSLAWSIDRGRRLSAFTVASDYARRGAVDDRAQPIPIDAWFDRGGDLDLIEHSTAIEALGGVLTLLWIPDDVAARAGLSDERTPHDLSALQWRLLLESELERGFARNPRA